MTHHKGHVITIAFLAMVSASAYAQQQHTDSQHGDQKTSSGSQLLQRAPQVQISRTPISNRPSLPPSIFRSPNTPRYSTPSSSGNDWLQRRQSYQPPQRSNPLRPSQPTQPTWHSPVVDRTRQGDLLQHRDPIMTPPSNPVIGGVEDRRHHQNPIYNAPRPPTVIQTPQGSINMPIHVLPKKDIDREDGRRRDNDRWHDGDRDDNRWRERDRDRWNDRWGTTVDWWRFNPTNFNYRSCSYRSYRNTYVTGSCYINPFGYYYGYCPPFINTYDCSYRPPVVIVIDQPIYQDNVFTGFQDTGTQDYSNDPYIEQTAPGLSNVTDDLVQTFGDGNMEGISDLVDPNTSIQVYQRGVYKYTIKSSEYLNLTRDAVNAIDPVEFVVQDVHAVSDGNYSISGKQTYRDKNGNQQTMFLSFVVTNSYGRWVITQIGTSPEEYHDLTTPY